ncbi:MAG TPA: FtsW/RodA/SpoVE family cell cycle protein, partial [Caulobacteraceae bacterium]
MTASALTRPGERDRLPVKLGQLDWRFAGLLLAIGGIGVLMLYSVAGQAWEPWAAKHLMRFSAVFVAMLILALVDLRVWFASAYLVYGVGLFLLICVELFGYTAMGATRWLQVGPIRMQPSEIMKIGIVLALARYYHGTSAHHARLSWRLLIPAGMIAAPVLLVAHQPDLGTAMLIALTGLAVMFMAGLSWKVIVAGVLGAAAAIPPFVFFVMHEYQRNRVLTFLNPESDPTGTGYHITQAKIAIGSGGLLGRGYGLGSQSQLSFLPEKQTDFIFPTVA